MHIQTRTFSIILKTKPTKFTFEAFQILSMGDPNQYWLMKCVLYKQIWMESL